MERPTRVIFRRWRNKEGGVLALFPDIPADNNGWLCSSYEHVGQHGGADYNLCIRHSRPAKPDEYAELAEELRRIGYVLDIRKKR